MDEQAVRFVVVGTQKKEMPKSWISKIFRAIVLKSDKIHLQKVLKFQKEDIYLLGKRGILVELPFEEEEVNSMPVQYLEDYIKKIIENYNVSCCYLRKELSFLKERFQANKKWIFRYLLFQEGISQFLEASGIEKKDARFVIIDSGDKKMEMILEVILEYANYLTIVTNRGEYFQNAVDIIYEELGLVVQIQLKQMQKNIDGNVVINLDRDYYQIYNNFQKDACVVDLEFTDKKLEYLFNRRKDIKILYDYDIIADNTKLDPDLVAEIIIEDNWRLNRFVNGRESVISVNELKSINHCYHIEIEKMRCLHL